MPYLTKKTLKTLLSAHVRFCESMDKHQSTTELTGKEKTDAYLSHAMIVSRYLEACKNADFYWFYDGKPKQEAYAELFKFLDNLEELADCKGAFTKRHETPKAPNQFRGRGAPAKIKGKRLDLLKAMLERKAKGEGNAKHLTNNQLCKAFGICIATLYKIRNGKEAYK